MKNNNELTEILAHCLEAIQQEQMSIQECLALYPQHREELTSLLGKITFVRSLSREKARADFRKKGYQALLNIIKDRQPKTTENRLEMIFQDLVVRGQQKFRPVGVIAAIVLAFFLVTGGVAYASDAAVPGDLLYGLDRALERIQLNLAANPEAAAALHLAFGEERLEELEDRIAADDMESAQEALDNYSAEIAALAELVGGREGFDELAQMDLIDAALAVHRDVLTRVLEKVPEQAQEAIQRAIDRSNIKSKEPGVQKEKDKPEKPDKPDKPGRPEDPGSQAPVASHEPGEIP